MADPSRATLVGHRPRAVAHRSRTSRQRIGSPDRSVPEHVARGVFPSPSGYGRWVHHHDWSADDDDIFNYDDAAPFLHDDDYPQHYHHDQHQYYNDHYPVVISCLRSVRRHRHH